MIRFSLSLSLSLSLAARVLAQPSLQWVLSNPSSSEINDCGLGKISEEMFERTVDMFEKVAYTQQVGNAFNLTSSAPTPSLMM
ncbi:hypothetical protein CMV_020614 [Castanea mollissima]|uniref:Uncharacterized protein n=1 Tax=Castanea mollissima TaxID=60419 RepID=A0A8J4QYP4_9ROSI|nr:hypothetical protein CMV_020614 [Castanea mollissima]